jgi:hypothetical protein
MVLESSLRDDRQGKYFDYSKQRMDGSIAFQDSGTAAVSLKIHRFGYWNKKGSVLNEEVCLAPPPFILSMALQ